MINKRTLYESLYKSFYPKSIVAFATTNGYRVCKDDPQMVDYDILYAIDSNNVSKTWVQITDFDQTPHVSLKINDFQEVYVLDAELSDIIYQSHDFNSLLQPEQDWVKQAHSNINLAFTNAGYVFP